MSDDRPFDRFHVLDGPIQPEGAFAERLFDALAADLGYRPERGLAGLRRRARRALGLERPPVGARALRLAYLAAILGLLVALAIGAALAAGQFLQRSAEDIVRASQALYRDGTVPAFTMTIRYRDASVDRFLWNGAGSLRIETVSGVGLGGLAAGSYIVEMPQGQGIFDAGADTWSQGSEPPLWPLRGLPLDWIVPVPVPAGQAPPTYTCPAWLREPDGTVAGRSVYHVTCGSLGFWIDTDTLVLLRRDDPQVDQLEVIGFEPGVSAPAEAFALVKPPGAYDPADRPPSTVLVVGQPAPTLSGPLLGGGTFTSASLAGRPSVVLFWASWCPPCSDPGGALDALGAAIGPRRSEMNVVTVASSDPPADLAAYLVKHPTELPVVLDDDGARLQAWGFIGIPSFILLDAAGRVAAVHAGAITAADLDRMAEAVLAGRPIPSPSPLPEPTPRPSPVIYTGESGATAESGLRIGDLAPEFDFGLVDNRGLSTTALHNRPTVLLVITDPCATCLVMLDDLARAYDARHDSVNLAALLWGTPTPELFAGIIDGGYRYAVVLRDGDLAEGLPVILDGDGYISSDQFALSGVPAVVFIDAGWRVAGVHLGPLSEADLAAALDALEGSRALPAP